MANPTMTAADSLCRSLLALVDAIPSTIPSPIVPTDQPRWLFIADGRPEASTLEMAAIAGELGQVITEQCFHSRRQSGHPIIGCIVEVPADADIDQKADELRAAYHLATSSGNDSPGETGPF